MTADYPFRWIVIAGTIALLVLVLPYRIKSQSTGESLDRRQEGLFVLATLRPAGALMWLGVIAYMVNPRWMAWSSLPLPAPLRWSGLALMALATALVVWTFRTLGPNLTDTVVTRRVHTLVTRGPYRWVRHPFYGALTLLIAAMGLLAANWFMLLCGIVVIAVLVVRTRTEEEKLVARFGDAYRTYMAQTGRFLPRPGASGATRP